MPKKAILVVTFAIIALALSAQEDPAHMLVEKLVAANNTEELYSQAANLVTARLQPSIQRYLKRPLSDDEKQRLVSYWVDALKELMPLESIEEVLASTIANHFTDEELGEIIQFYETPVGKKLLEITPTITKEFRSAERDLISKMGDKETLRKLLERFRKEFPDWLPKDEGA